MHTINRQAYDVIGGNTDLSPVLLQDGAFDAFSNEYRKDEQYVSEGIDQS